MEAAVPGEGQGLSAEGGKTSKRKRLSSVLALFSKARWKLSTRVSPGAQQARRRAKGGQMQKMSENMDDVEDMETEMSPERM